ARPRDALGERGLLPPRRRLRGADGRARPREAAPLRLLLHGDDRRVPPPRAHRELRVELASGSVEICVLLLACALAEFILGAVVYTRAARVATGRDEQRDLLGALGR